MIYWVANLSSLSAYLWSLAVLALDVYATQMGVLNSDILSSQPHQFKGLPLVPSRSCLIYLFLHENCYLCREYICGKLLMELIFSFIEKDW